VTQKPSERRAAGLEIYGSRNSVKRRGEGVCNTLVERKGNPAVKKTIMQNREKKKSQIDVGVQGVTVWGGLPAVLGRVPNHGDLEAKIHSRS